MTKLKILYVEDSRIDFEMVKAILEEEDLVQSIRRVDKKEEFLSALKEEKFDVVLTDYSLPVFHGLEAIHILKTKYPDLPVIMITGNLADEIAVDVMKKGAWDYVLKENIYRLVPAILNAVENLKIKKERQAALESLKESETNYRVLAESSPYGIIVHADRTILYHNQVAMRIFRVPDKVESLVGLKIEEYVHPDYKETLAERFGMLYRGEEMQKEYEIKFLDYEKNELFLEVASSPINFNGQPAAQVIFRDIADRKKMERDLILAKERAEASDRLKSSFLENLSHEIRTPLNGIIGFASLLKLKDLSQEDRENYVKVIEDSGKHLLTIIDDLIEISRIESGQFELRNERFLLNEIMDELYLFFNSGDFYKNTNVILGLTKGLRDQESVVIGDKARLKQVLFNLLSNAFKFTREGRIDFGYRKPDEDGVLFFVRDSGIGIPDDFKEIIFERFRQVDNTSSREYGGNGLGLSICKGIVNAMQGKIWFDSRVDQGSDFYFRIKLNFLNTAVITKRSNQSSKKQSYEWKGKNALVAEDENSNFVLLKHILERTGIGITHVKNGRDVISILENGNRFDIILMDVKMPEMDGMETIRILRERDIQIPVIAQTAYAMTEDRDKCLKAGCNDYITKPIRSSELLGKMQTFLNKQG